MIVWTVANQKGGVGKTTTAISLGALLARAGQRTLLIDLDPHGSMTSHFGLDPDAPGESAYTLFHNTASGRPLPASSMLQQTGVERLTLLPADTALATLDRQFGNRDGMGLVLAHTLGQWKDRFDRVLIDCPPMLGILMVNALACCRLLLAPVQTEFLALKGLERLLHTLSMINRRRPTPLEYLVVPTMFDRRTRAAIDSLRRLREQHAGHIWQGVIPVDTKFREASQAGKPLPLMLPRSRGSIAYAELLESLLQREQADVARQPLEVAG
ncbi:MAG: ParA family protein [Gammaproteobacteria bacterium]|nr:MAG: ParA family protein [Gammaproteobacteria bacterium]